MWKRGEVNIGVRIAIAHISVKEKSGSGYYIQTHQDINPYLNRNFFILFLNKVCYNLGSTKDN